MPITIALCDDDKQQLLHMEKLLTEWKVNRRIDIKMREYRSAEQFLFDYEENPCDIILLDIEMDGMNGMELAQKLRYKGDMLPIVFITGFSEYMNDGYDVDALHYLLKPVEKERLYKVLDKYVDRCDTLNHILLPCEKGTVRISEDTIIYCEAFGKKTHLMLLSDKELICSCGINAISKQLSNSFIFCHRSYLINVRYIRSIGRSSVNMDNGNNLPLSRRLYDNVNQAFISYYRERIK